MNVNKTRDMYDTRITTLKDLGKLISQEMSRPVTSINTAELRRMIQMYNEAARDALAGL